MRDKVDMMNDNIEIPATEPGDFDEVYESIKDSPEAVKELEGIMKEFIDRMEPLVDKYKAFAKRDPADQDVDEYGKLEEERNSIEIDRLSKIAVLLQNELDRKEARNRELKADIDRYTHVKHRPENGNRKVYPNDPCPCGSGKKYKKCCGR